MSLPMRERAKSQLNTFYLNNSGVSINYNIRKTSESIKPKTSLSKSRHCISCTSQISKNSKTLSLKNQENNKIQKPKYNKWYIQPRDRLKKIVQAVNHNKTNPNFYYNFLFRSQYPDPKSPFKNILSQKLKLSEKFSQNNIRCLQTFHRRQLQSKKRVPSIVQIIMKNNPKKMHN